MAQPLKATKYSELVNCLNAMLNDRTLINEFELKRIEKEAGSLPEIEERYVVLGMIACIKNDISAMHSCHKNSIRLSPSNTEIKIQYFVSLRSLGLYQEAFDLTLDMHNNNPLDQIILYNLILMAGKLDDHVNFNKFLSEYIKLIDPPDLDSPDVKVKIFMLRHGLTDEINDIFGIIKNNFSSIISLETSCYADPESNTEGVSIDLVVDSDVDQFLDEYSKYTNKLIETIPLNKMDYLHLNYSFA